MTLRLHPIPPKLLSGKLIYNEAQIAPGLQLYRRLLLSGPDELGLDAAILLDSSGKKELGFTVCHSGANSTRQSVLEPLSSLGFPEQNRVEFKTYQDIQYSDHTPFGRRYYYRSGFIEELGDDLIRLLIDAVNQSPVPRPGSEFFISFQQAGGAIRRVQVEDTAFPHRKALCNIIAMAIMDNSQEYEVFKKTIDDIAARIAPCITGIYANDGLTSSQHIQDIYTVNYSRLQKVKRQYDPENIFFNNVNISG